MLSRFPNRTLKVGAVVSLSPQTNWSRNSSNPIGISGKVTRNQYDASRTNYISVDWDNGCSNSYHWDHYDLIAEGEPGFLATE